MRSIRLTPLLLLPMAAACPPAGDCQVDEDCGAGFACREDPVDNTPVCIQVFNGGDAGPQDPVSILNFAATPETVGAGETTTLSWETENATNCALSGGLGGVDTSGSIEVTVDDTTQFALTCQGDGGPAVERVTVAVTVDITSFTATPNEIDQPGEVTLAWETVGADGDCRLRYSDEVGEFQVASTGSHTFSPVGSGDAALSCVGAGGTAEASVAVAVARIVTLGADPAAVAIGQTVTLSWTAENATGCAIAGEADPDPDDDELLVSPAATTSYSLRCDGFSAELRRDVEAVVLISRWEPEAATVASGEDAVFLFTLDPRVASCTLEDATPVDISAGRVTIPGVTADETRQLVCQDGTATVTSEPATVTVQ